MTERREGPGDRVSLVYDNKIGGAWDQGAVKLITFVTEKWVDPGLASFTMESWASPGNETI